MSKTVKEKQTPATEYLFVDDNSTLIVIIFILTYISGKFPHASNKNKEIHHFELYNNVCQKA